MLLPRASRLLFSFLLLVSLNDRASATTMAPMAVETLVAKAEAVVRGVVVKRRVSRENGRVVTRVELKLEEVLKGRIKGGEATIVQAGGTLGEKRTRVVGAPEFALGSEVVVFLVFNNRGDGVVLGLSQGKFDVFAGAGGRKQVRNRFHGGLAETSSSGQAILNRLGNRSLTLEQLRERVRRQVK